jgi:hypothetical protein
MLIAMQSFGNITVNSKKRLTSEPTELILFELLNALGAKTMATYFEKLSDELRLLSWSALELIALEEYGVDPDDFETKEELVQACVAREQYAAFS